MYLIPNEFDQVVNPEFDMQASLSICPTIKKEVLGANAPIRAISSPMIDTLEKIKKKIYKMLNDDALDISVSQANLG